MALQSQTKLFSALDKFFGSTEFSEKGLTAPGMGNETFGRKSMIYVGARGRRGELESFLEAYGFRPNRGYFKGSQIVEVQVSYFKGWHHAE